MIGVSFDDTHCFDDLGLVLASKDIGLPEPQTTYIQVPGRNGDLDLTEEATGSVRFNSRTIVLTFNTCKNISKSDWPLLLTKVATAIHGEQKKIIFDDDNNFYYLGRCKIDTFETDQGKQIVTINCTCDPYKYNIAASDEPWLWDPFSFVNGVAQSSGEVTINSANAWQEVVIEGYVYNTTLQITCTRAMTLQFEGVEYELAGGMNTLYDITLKEGANSLYFKGTGVVTIITRGGRF